MATVLHVTVEFEPHTDDLRGVLLNRPAPQQGCFLIADRIDRDDFPAVTAAGATYMDAELLEDMDRFDALPGWRYTTDALKVLLARGYTLKIRDTSVTSTTDLDALFTEEAKAAYRQGVEAEHQRIADEQEAAHQREHEQLVQLQATYRAWQAEHLTGLVYTSADPPESNGGPGWRQIAVFDGRITDTSFGNECWYRAEQYQEPAYRCHYGTADSYYTSQSLADSWVVAHWEQRSADKDEAGIARAARHVLRDAGQEYKWADISDRLIAMYGVAYFVERARRTPWLVLPVNGGINAVRPVIEAHQLPAVALEYMSGIPWEVERQLENPLKREQLAHGATRPYRASSLYRGDDGTYYGLSGMFESDLWPLTPEQLEHIQPYLPR